MATKWGKDDEKWLRELFRRHARYFGQHPFKLEFLFRKTDERDEDGITKMSVNRHYPYRTVDVCVYPEFWKQNQRSQRLDVFHEIIHLVLWEMGELRSGKLKAYQNAEENAIDTLALAYSKLYEENEKLKSQLRMIDGGEGKSGLQ